MVILLFIVFFTVTISLINMYFYKKRTREIQKQIKSENDRNYTIFFDFINELRMKFEYLDEKDKALHSDMTFKLQDLHREIIEASKGKASSSKKK